MDSSELGLGLKNHLVLSACACEKTFVSEEQQPVLSSGCVSTFFKSCILFCSLLSENDRSPGTMPSLIHSTVIYAAKCYFYNFWSKNKTKLLPHAYFVHAAYFCCKFYYLKKNIFIIWSYFFISSIKLYLKFSKNVVEGGNINLWNLANLQLYIKLNYISLKIK